MRRAVWLAVDEGASLDELLNVLVEPIPDRGSGDTESARNGRDRHARLRKRSRLPDRGNAIRHTSSLSNSRSISVLPVRFELTLDAV